MFQRREWVFRSKPVFHFGLLLCCWLLSPGLAYADGCSISETDLQANSKLSFWDFDQTGVLPSTARKLSERRCYPEAASAGQHYLLFGPPRTPRENSIVIWHVSQNLAMAGREADAALMAIAAIRAPDSSDEADHFDWNAYVRGTWAFLTKDRALLEQSIENLKVAQGARNEMNARVLEALNQCFDRSYLDAYNESACKK